MPNGAPVSKGGSAFLVALNILGVRPRAEGASPLF